MLFDVRNEVSLQPFWRKSLAAWLSFSISGSFPNGTAVKTLLSAIAGSAVAF